MKVDEEQVQRVARRIVDERVAPVDLQGARWLARSVLGRLDWSADLRYLVKVDRWWRAEVARGA